MVDVKKAKCGWCGASFTPTYETNICPPCTEQMQHEYAKIKAARDAFDKQARDMKQ